MSDQGSKREGGELEKAREAAKEPWWVDALESVATPYFKFCREAGKLMRGVGRRGAKGERGRPAEERPG
jgi:hypothetical protein